MTIFTVYDPASLVNTALSNNNATVTSTLTGTGSPAGNVGASSYATDALSSGKIYFEDTWTNFTGGDFSFGIGSPSSGFNGMGNTGGVHGVVCSNAAHDVFVEGTNVGNTGKTAVNGDVIAVAIDFGSKLIWFKNVTQSGNWNGSGTANPATGTGGFTYSVSGALVAFATAGGTGGVPTDVHTTNFGASSFVGTVPSGFTSGWPSVNSGTGFDPSSAIGVSISNSFKTGTNTLTANPTGCKGVAADAKSSGLLYWEMHGLSSAGGSQMSIGLNAPTSTISNQVTTGGGSGGIGLYDGGGGSVFVSGSNTGVTIGTIIATDVIGIAVDMTHMKVWFKNITQASNWNGSGTANPATNTGGIAITATPLVPFFGWGGGGSTGQAMVANFSGPFSGTIPSGFSSWDAAPGVSGTWASTEATDIATFTNVVKGPWASTEATDVMTAHGGQPVEGTFNRTEAPDTWATSSGFARLRVESENAQGNYTGGATFNTGGPDRIVIMVATSVAVSLTPSQVTTVTDTAGLTWKPASFAIAGPDANGGEGRIDVWWAYAHNQLINDAISVTIVGNSTTANVSVFAVSGLNGNYTYPFDATGFGGNFGGMSGSAQDVKFGLQYVTGNGLGGPPGVLGFTVITGWSGVGSPLFSNLTGFSTLTQALATGAQRNTTTAIQTVVSPVGFTTAQNYMPDSGSNQLSWMLQWLTLAEGTSTPGSWLSTEATDHAVVIGHPGAAGIVGDLTVTGLPDIASIFGFQRDSGVFITQENPDIFSAFLKQPITGHWTSTGAPDQMAATGLGRGENGIFVAFEGVDTLTITGYTPNSGTFITTEAADRFNAIGAGVIRVRGRRQSFVT